MHPEGFKPLTRSLFSLSTIVLTLLGSAVVFDLLSGQRMLVALALYQLKLTGQHAAANGTVTTLFGTFDSIYEWATFAGRALAAVLLGLPALSVLHGLWSSIRGH